MRISDWSSDVCSSDLGDGQHQRDPEATRHVDQFGTRPSVGGDHFRLEPHAADGTGAGMVLPDFGVHRAGPDRPRRGIHHPVGRRDQIMFWIADEFRAAASTTKMILMVGMGCMMRRLLWIDSHAANGIDHQAQRSSLVLPPMASTTTMAPGMRAMLRLGHQPSPSIAQLSAT